MGSHLPLQRRLDRLLDHVRQQTALTGQLDAVELRLLDQPSHLSTQLRRHTGHIISFHCHGSSPFRKRTASYRSDPFTQAI
jgi:hypothetical protein